MKRAIQITSIVALVLSITYLILLFSSLDRSRKELLKNAIEYGKTNYEVELRKWSNEHNVMIDFMAVDSMHYATCEYCDGKME